MNRLRTKISLIPLVVALICGVLWHSGRAQQTLMGMASHFKMTEYFASPHDTQVKSLISGAEAQPQTGGRYLIKQLKLETFREDGVKDMTVEAPECTYDGVKREAASPGHILVRSGDGQYVIEGEGFLWQQDDSKLFISNDVHTVVQNTVSTNQP